MKIVNFPEVVDFLEGPGVRNWQFRESGVKLINIRNLVNDKINLSNTTNFLDTKEVSEKYKHFLVSEGDFLMASSGVTWGKIAEVKTEHLPLCLNTSIIKLLPKNPQQLEKRFLWHFIKSFSFRRQIERLITGSAQPNFGPSHLEQIQIPLPPLDTQKKIAAILDAADAYRQKTKTLIEKYDQLAQSLFLDMFGDPVRNPKEWITTTVEEVLITKTQNGHYVPKEQYSEDGIAMVHMSDAFYGRVRLNNIKRVRISTKEAEKFMLKDTDIILARRSLNYEGAAKPCLVPKIEETLIYESSLIRLSPNLKKVNTMFLYYYLSNEEARKAHVYQYITKSTISGINNKDLNKVKIYLAPINLQNLFSERIQLIEAQKQQAQASLQKAEDLFNSLLQRAFKGELVS